MCPGHATRPVVFKSHWKSLLPDALKPSLTSLAHSFFSPSTHSDGPQPSSHHSLQNENRIIENAALHRPGLFNQGA